MGEKNSPNPENNGKFDQVTLDIPPDIFNTKKTEPKYTKIKKIGEGTYAVVYLGMDDQKKHVAIKKVKNISTNTGLDFSAIREIKCLKQLKHPNIINLIDVYLYKSHINMVLEYAELNLEILIKDPTIIFMPPDIKAWMLMLMRAVDFCHQNWVLHRDIKPNNLLIDSKGNLKLADFGLARDFGNINTLLTSNVITRWYQPPELLFGSKTYSQSVDSWSIGCIFAELMLRVPFFPGNSDIAQLNLIFSKLGSISENEWPNISSLPNYVTLKTYPKVPLKDYFSAASNDALDLLQKLLILNPEKRITPRDALLHPYFTNPPYPTNPLDLPRSSQQH